MLIRRIYYTSQSLDKIEVLIKSCFESVFPWYTVQKWLVWDLFVYLHLNCISVFLWFHIFVERWKQEFKLHLEWSLMTLQIWKLCLFLISRDLCLDSVSNHFLILLSQSRSVFLETIREHFLPHFNFCFGLCEVLLWISRLSTAILLLKDFLLK